MAKSNTSHPTWVRGLKLTLLSLMIRLRKMSHPTWVRGLKFRSTANLNEKNAVAPHVGAWIEIGDPADLGALYKVAPHVGAWIEIYLSRNPSLRHRSHPTWVRGLKLQAR